MPLLAEDATMRYWSWATPAPSLLYSFQPIAKPSEGAAVPSHRRDECDMSILARPLLHRLRLVSLSSPLTPTATPVFRQHQPSSSGGPWSGTARRRFSSFALPSPFVCVHVACACACGLCVCMRARARARSVALQRGGLRRAASAGAAAVAVARQNVRGHSAPALLNRLRCRRARRWSGGGVAGGACEYPARPGARRATLRLLSLESPVTVIQDNLALRCATSS
jgi:hypothetical protein